MSNIICNNIVSSGNFRITGDFVLETNNSNTMTVNSRSIFNGDLNCGTLNTNRQITQTGAVGINTGTGKINLQGDVEILGDKSFTTGTGNININGILNLANKTPSTNWSYGAVTIKVGLDVLGSINSGENISCTGSLNLMGGTVINGDGILLKTNGEIHLEAGIDLPIYLNNDIVCEKSIYLNGPSSIIASSGTIQGKYF